MLKIERLSSGILRNLELQIDEEECVAVVGPSGCGKTTLLNAIAGYSSYQGDILLRQQQKILL